jgi:ribosomal protein L11 methyltransferase
MSPTGSSAADDDRAGRHWVAVVECAASVDVPELGPVDRAEFAEWLWARFGEKGLVGIDEGSVDATAAAAAGLAESALVIDVAAAPAERDWVAAAAGPLELVFDDERSCREAVAALAALPGVRAAPRRAVASPLEPQPPVAVEGFGWILPPGARAPAGDPSPGSHRVFLDAGAGFGTGLHPTTQLCLREIARHVADGGRLDRVLDCGAGSGVLGIAAATLGAAHVDAIEIDTGVHGAIRGNSTASGVASRVHVAETLPATGVAGTPPQPYDLVLANIVAGVLLDLAAPIAAGVATGGRLVLSGLRAGEVDEVAARYEAALAGRGPGDTARPSAGSAGARPRSETEDGWWCLVFSR